MIKIGGRKGGWPGPGWGYMVSASLVSPFSMGIVSNNIVYSVPSDDSSVSLCIDGEAQLSRWTGIQRSVLKGHSERCRPHSRRAQFGGSNIIWHQNIQENSASGQIYSNTH